MSYYNKTSGVGSACGWALMELDEWIGMNGMGSLELDEWNEVTRISP